MFFACNEGSCLKERNYYAYFVDGTDATVGQKSDAAIMVV